MGSSNLDCNRVLGELEDRSSRKEDSKESTISSGNSRFLALYRRLVFLVNGNRMSLIVQAPS